jgi:hypothetical protein
MKQYTLETRRKRGRGLCRLRGRREKAVLKDTVLVLKKERGLLQVASVVGKEERWRKDAVFYALEGERSSAGGFGSRRDGGSMGDSPVALRHSRLFQNWF